MLTITATPLTLTAPVAFGEVVLAEGGSVIPDQHITVAINGPPAPTPTPTPATPTPTPSPGTPTPTPTPTRDAHRQRPPASATPSPSATPPGQTVNLSTRMFVQTGDNVGIGGFIITGTGPKNVLIRAIGPSLTQCSVPNALADTVLELHGTGGFPTVINNDWRDTQEAEIQATGIAPTNDLESAILASLIREPIPALLEAMATPPESPWSKSTTSTQARPRSWAISPPEPLSAPVTTSSSRASSWAAAPALTTSSSVDSGRAWVGWASRTRWPIRPWSCATTTERSSSQMTTGRMIRFKPRSFLLLVWRRAIVSSPPSRRQLTPGPYTVLLAGLSGGTGNGLVEIYDLATGDPFPTPTPGVSPSPGCRLRLHRTPTRPRRRQVRLRPQPSGQCTENFDGPVDPAPGVGGGNRRRATASVGHCATNPDSAPNNAFMSDTAVISDKRLNSRPITISSASAQVSFRNRYDFEFSMGTFWDGGVLEASVNGAAFVDVIHPSISGGSFVSGGYNGTISGIADNPLSGQSAWASSSGGYITSTINLNASLQGTTIVLRWRCGTDQADGAPGWWVDNLTVTGGSCPPP